MRRGVRQFHKAIEHRGTLFDVDVVCLDERGSEWEWCLYALVAHPSQESGPLFYYTHVRIHGPVRFEPGRLDRLDGLKAYERAARAGYEQAEEWLNAQGEKWRARLVSPVQ